MIKKPPYRSCDLYNYPARAVGQLVGCVSASALLATQDELADVPDVAGSPGERRAKLACALGGSKGPLRPQNNSFLYRAGGRKVFFEPREHKPDT